MDIDVLNIYGSPRAAVSDDTQLVGKLGSLINQGRFTILVGDFNICTNRGHVVLSFLESMGFKQFITKATHLHMAACWT